MQTNQKLSIKEKRKVFNNQIRQQKRDTYRQKARENQFNFFSSIGFTDIQEDHMMSYVMEEEQKMIVQQFTMDDECYEKMLFEEKEKIYKIIGEYRWKDFEHELGMSEYLKIFHKNGRKFIDEENLSIEETCWEAIEKDLDALLIILSKEIFLNHRDRTVERNCLLDVRRFIALWIHKIFTILGQSYKQFGKITDLASAIVELLIGFEIKS